jgi:hypothetical protein
MFLDIKLGNQQNGLMKTTLDLPDELVREIKLRAVHEGRKLKEVVADLLRAGLSPVRTSSRRGETALPKKLPVMKVRPVRMTAEPKLNAREWCDWLKEADLQLDVEQHEKTLGH